MHWNFNQRRRLTPLTRNRGGIYIVILATSMIMTTLGLAAMYSIKVKNHSTKTSSQVTQARLAARSAIEVALFQLASDDTWRNSTVQGPLITNLRIGNATVDIDIQDPVDADFANDDNHPIVLKVTATVGRGKYITSVQLQPHGPKGINALEYTLIAGQNIYVENSTITTDFPIAANTNIDANTSIINAHTFAVDNITGSSYTKSTNANLIVRTLPDAAALINEYTANAKTISFNSIPEVDSNFLVNSQMENGTNGWIRVGGSPNIATQASVHPTRGNVLIVSSRVSDSEGVGQDITSKLTAGQLHNFTIDVCSKFGRDIRLGITLIDDAGTRTITLGANYGVADWDRFEIDFTPTWTGTLHSAIIFVDTVDGSTEYFFIDNARLHLKSTPTDRTIQNHVISSRRNPFGGVNPHHGIYLIDCGGQRIVIENTRIVGTLLLIDPAPDSVIRGSINWLPLQSNQPVLITNKSITLALSRIDLSEETQNTNFNPANHPYPYLDGETDNDTTDTYPSTIEGLIYSAENITIESTPNIKGSIIAAGSINVRYADLNITRLTYPLITPPTGFSRTNRPLTFTHGTWRKRVTGGSNDGGVAAVN